MIPYYGDFAEDDTVQLLFNTFSSDDPSASVTVTDLVDADIMVHKDGALAQIAVDGASVIIDFDGVTGNHMITIDTSVDAAYSVGSEYQVRIEGTTVDGATINAWIGAFSIERAGGALALIQLIPTTPMRGTDSANTTVPPTAAAIVNEWEAQSQADPTGFHVNIKEWNDDPITSTLETSVDVNAAVEAGQVGTDAAAAVADLANTTDGLGAIKGVVDAIPTTPMRGTNNAALPGDILNLLTTQLTESYAAEGVAPTLSQLLFLVMQQLTDFSISGTTLTVRDLAGNPIATYTLDDAVNPTDINRAT